MIPAQLLVLEIGWDCCNAAEESYHTGACEGRQTADYLYIVNRQVHVTIQVRVRAVKLLSTCTDMVSRQVCFVIAGGTDDTGR